MTVPFRVGEEDPLEILKAIRQRQSLAVATGVPQDDPDDDPLAQLKALQKPTLRESLQLDVRTPSESTAAVPFDPTDRSSNFAGLPSDAGPVALGLMATAGQIVPGAETVQAGIRSLARGQPFKESLKDMRGVTDDIPLPIKLATQIPGLAGGVSALGKIPGRVGAMLKSPVKAGATIGAADQALAADDRSLGDRAARTVAGGVGGAVIGKGADLASTALRTLIAPSTSKQLARLTTDRAASAGPLYDQAAQQGIGRTNTPAIQAFLKKPDVAEIVTELQKTREFTGVAAEDPKMLDAIYKTFSDRAALAKRQLDAVTPSKPNIGRFRERDIRAAQQEQLTAMDPVMPAYRAGVQDYAQKSGLIEATKRGHDALRSRLNRNLPLGKSLKNTSPEAFEKYLETASPEQAAIAAQGILGGTQGAFGQSVRKSGLPALWKAGDMLRKTKTKEQLALDYLIRAGLLTAATP